MICILKKNCFLFLDLSRDGQQLVEEPRRQDEQAKPTSGTKGSQLGYYLQKEVGYWKHFIFLYTPGL